MSKALWAKSVPGARIRERASFAVPEGSCPGKGLSRLSGREPLVDVPSFSLSEPHVPSVSLAAPSTPSVTLSEQGWVFALLSLAFCHHAPWASWREVQPYKEGEIPCLCT